METLDACATTTALDDTPVEEFAFTTDDIRSERRRISLLHCVNHFATLSRTVESTKGNGIVKNRMKAHLHLLASRAIQAFNKEEPRLPDTAVQSTAYCAPVVSIHNTSDLHKDACFVVFDTETTGLGTFDVAIQFACIVCNQQGDEVQTIKWLWKKPRGVFISSKAVKVHKITHEQLRREGKLPQTGLCMIDRMFKTSQSRDVPWIAHNASFDRRILSQTAKAWGVDMPAFAATQTHDFFCTMLRSKEHVSQDLRRSLSNQNLYKYLHNRDANTVYQLHDALDDCRVTAQNYLKARARGWWHRGQR